MAYVKLPEPIERGGPLSENPTEDLEHVIRLLIRRARFHLAHRVSARWARARRVLPAAQIPDACAAAYTRAITARTVRLPLGDIDIPAADAEWRRAGSPTRAAIQRERAESHREMLADIARFDEWYGR